MFDISDYQVDIVLIRHGQVQGNLEKKLIGKTDEPLTEEGRKDIASREYPKADMVFTSSMKRCMETCSIIYPDLEPVVVDELREMNFGKLEGKSAEELEDNEDFKNWKATKGRKTLPGGDNLDLFMLRTTRGMSKILHSVIEKIDSQEENKKMTVAIVTHGGTIMALQSYLGLCDFFDKMYDNGEWHLIGTDVRYDAAHDCITIRLR